MAPEGFGSTFKRPAGSAVGTPSPNKKQKLLPKGEQPKHLQVSPNNVQKLPKNGAQAQKSPKMCKYITIGFASQRVKNSNKAQLT